MASFDVHRVLAMRHRGLAKDTAWSMALEVVSLSGTIISFALLGRSLGAAGYGEYASLYAVIGPLVTLAASGVTLSLMEHVIRDREDLERTARSCLSMSLLIGALLTLVGVGIATRIIEGLSMVAIVSIVLAEFLTVPAAQIAATTVQSRSGFIPATRMRLLMTLARLVLIVALFALDQLSVATLGASYLLMTLVFALIYLRTTANIYGITMRPGRIQRAHFKTSLWYSGGISGLALQNDGDKAVLAAYDFTVQTGLYSAAYRIVQMGLMPPTAFMGSTHQRFLETEPGVKGQHLRRSLLPSSLSRRFSRGSSVRSSRARSRWWSGCRRWSRCGAWRCFR
jgi:O-antigen/teichoic acid export membrane protein